MKIRIRGNSLRIRVSRSEVHKLSVDGYLEEKTCFGENTLVYALQRISGTTQLSADFTGCKITMYVPEILATGWAVNTIVGFNAKMPLPGNDSLSLLLEKDFVCIGQTAEDQNDNYENLSKNC